jgi:3-deoxy-D-manno-octulosonic-acid transferase
MLSKIYRYATIAYVGGGFNKAGIHNILEAAVYGKIVFWGPNYDRAAEASAMIEIGCGYSFDKKDTLYNQIKFLLENHKELEDKSQAAATYVKSNTGATSRIMVFLQHSNII